MIKYIDNIPFWLYIGVFYTYINKLAYIMNENCNIIQETQSI